MGERGCIGFRYKDKDYVEYCQWGAFPSENGVGILRELRKVSGKWDQVKKHIVNIELLSQEQWYNIRQNSVCDDTKDANYKAPVEDFGYLKHYMNGTRQRMIDSALFMQDSFSNQYSFIVNLDSMQYEMWTGILGIKPPAGNRYGEMSIMSFPGSPIYYPCILVVAFDLHNLPSDKVFLIKTSEAMRDAIATNPGAGKDLF